MKKIIPLTNFLYLNTLVNGCVIIITTEFKEIYIPINIKCNLYGLLTIDNANNYSIVYENQKVYIINNIVQPVIILSYV